MAGIDDLDVVRQLDVAGQHGAGTGLAQDQGDFVAVVQLEDHALQVQQDVDDIFANARMVEYSCTTPVICTSVGA